MADFDDPNANNLPGNDGTMTQEQWNASGGVNGTIPVNTLDHNYDNTFDNGDMYSWTDFNSYAVDITNYAEFSSRSEQMAANPPPATESGFFQKMTAKLDRAFDGKEGDKMIGMGVLAALNGIANHKYKEAQLKANQQVGAAAESRERRAAENAKSAGQAFGMIGKPQSGFKPISPVPRTGG